jgi:aspartyl-tRNA(Asn)/glutamyl-tRNA(Gln) amidotransferase subunit A
VTATHLADCTATELLALYRSGQASPVDATQAVLTRIERINPALLAYCFVAAADALSSAGNAASRSARSTACPPRSRT